jgi:hypothetical protein
MRVTQNDRLKTFIRELDIDPQKIYNASSKEEVIEYTRQKYIEYVKKKKNSEDSTFKTINEVWSAIRRDPEILFSFVLKNREAEIPKTNKNTYKNSTNHYATENSKNTVKSKTKSPKTIIEDFFIQDEDLIFDKIIVPMTLKEIYRGGKRVIVLKNKDILEFEVTPYNFNEDIQVVSRSNMLYIVSIKVNDSKWWLDDKINLHTTISVPLYDCMLGCITAIEYLDGEMMKVEVPSETYDTIRLNGLGWPVKQNKRTDLVIHINIEFPRNISEYEREILKTLQKIEKIKKSNFNNGV